jgi:hypothetical protein
MRYFSGVFGSVVAQVHIVDVADTLALMALELTV